MPHNKFKISEFGFNILQIETSAGCNMSCSFCPYSLKHDKSSKLSLEKVFDIIDQVEFEDPKFKYITFSQFNEPLLDNRIFEIIRFAKKKNIKVLLITNGLLLNKKKNVENIIDLQPDIKISLQVLDDLKHKEARGINLELDKYVNTIIDFCNKSKNKNFDITVDVGCNFNESFSMFFLKKLFGMQTGDPSAPFNVKSTIHYIKKYADLFFDMAEDEYKKDFSQLTNFEEAKSNFSKSYMRQNGFKISKNIILKFKPFFYGKRIKDFYPRNDNFECDSKILSVLADGNVVPCCLAYDDSITLGKVDTKPLYDILNESALLKNLRIKGAEKHETCKKCFGEPTKRGVKFREIYGSLVNQ